MSDSGASSREPLDFLRACQAAARRPGPPCASCDALPGSVTLPPGAGDGGRDPRFARLRTLAALHDGCDQEIRLCPECGTLWAYRFECETCQLSFSPSDPEEVNPAREECVRVGLEEAAARAQGWAREAGPGPSQG
ncbi:MAG: hypothetical protein HY823_11340 [Acidobacteria bacterium]|nr:hypothetical protein [Acidobacteriota bacterium]